MTDKNWLATVILSLFSTGVLTALIAWFKDRHKDSAAANLADIQTLQAKLAYIQEIAEALQKRNEILQNDYDELEERYRKIRERAIQLEEELDRVKRSAAHTQVECDRLSERLKELLGEVNR